MTHKRMDESNPWLGNYKMNKGKYNHKGQPYQELLPNHDQGPEFFTLLNDLYEVILMNQ